MTGHVTQWVAVARELCLDGNNLLTRKDIQVICQGDTQKRTIYLPQSLCSKTNICELSLKGYFDFLTELFANKGNALASDTPPLSPLLKMQSIVRSFPVLGALFSCLLFLVLLIDKSNWALVKMRHQASFTSSTRITEPDCSLFTTQNYSAAPHIIHPITPHGNPSHLINRSTNMGGTSPQGLWRYRKKRKRAI